MTMQRCEPIFECNKFVRLDDKKSPLNTNRADCRTIQDDPFLVSFSAKHKGIWGDV